jgi:hypothetical protein
MANPSSVSKEKLSGSTDGRGIKIAATGTPGTTLHTAQAGTSSNVFDEVWIWVVNSSTSNVKLTIEFGGTTSPDDTIEVTIPAESGLVLVIPGLVLQNSDVIKAFAGTTNVLIAFGYVNRISA